MQVEVSSCILRLIKWASGYASLSCNIGLKDFIRPQLSGSSSDGDLIAQLNYVNNQKPQGKYVIFFAGSLEARYLDRGVRKVTCVLYSSIHMLHRHTAPSCPFKHCLSSSTTEYCNIRHPCNLFHTLSLYATHIIHSLLHPLRPPDTTTSPQPSSPHTPYSPKPPYPY